MFPEVGFDVAFSWAGTFGDNTGETTRCPNSYFALGYGGNGITYSIIVAQVIRDLYTGRPNLDVEVLAFER